jgi:hypothetical protein
VELGVEYVVYLSSGGSATVDLSAASGRKLRVRCFNPRTGEFQSAGAVPGGNSAQEFKPQFAGDAGLNLGSTSQ